VGTVSRVATVRQAAGGPCSTVSNFLADAINGLFNALRITVPATASGFFADVGRVLATVWNTAVSYAQKLIQGLIDTITAPVFEAIRLAVGVVGVASMVVTYLVDQKLTVSVDPPSEYRFAVGAEADIKGQFVARPTDLTGDWPPAIVDCAQVAGATLPTLLKAGTAATWTVAFFVGPVIAPAALQTTVNNDLSVRLDFVTGHESDEDAKGDPMTGAAIAKVQVPRKEVGDFLDLGRQQLASAEQLLTSQIPEPTLRAAAQAGLEKIVEPVVSELETEIAGNAPTIFTLQGTSEPLLVLFHKPPDATPKPVGNPTPKPTASQNGFCPMYRDYLAWAKSQGGGDTITRAQATEITVRFTDMRPLAPPELLSWVNLMISIYGRYAVLPDNVHIPIVGADAAEIPAALNAMNKFCGLPPLGA